MILPPSLVAGEQGIGEAISHEIEPRHGQVHQVGPGKGGVMVHPPGKSASTTHGISGIPECTALFHGHPTLDADHPVQLLLTHDIPSLPRRLVQRTYDEAGALSGTRA
ncbi:MAG TPA: hypothetical protein DIU15_04875, partial [Deltaproteobacteria bacterium]|nr:hypothetical protein [Deltaproteobacteria bacterium]